MNRKTKTPAVQGATLTRLDYATSVSVTKRSIARSRPIATEGVDFDVVIARPIQVSVAMRASYAAELLRQLRDAPRSRRRGCIRISIDCPVEIDVDAATLASMLAALGGVAKDRIS